MQYHITAREEVGAIRLVEIRDRRAEAPRDRYMIAAVIAAFPREFRVISTLSGAIESRYRNIYIYYRYFSVHTLLISPVIDKVQYLDGQHRCDSTADVRQTFNAF